MNDYNELHALYHHGIKGQKWGIRRYQNEDGSLTPKGKDRYYEEERARLSEKYFEEDGDPKDWKDNGETRREALDRAYEKYEAEVKALDRLRKERLRAAKKDIKEQHLKPSMFKSRKTNAARGKAAAEYIQEKYGKQTVKDYFKSETNKTVAIVGVTYLASIGIIAYEVRNYIKNY